MHHFDNNIFICLTEVMRENAQWRNMNCLSNRIRYDQVAHGIVTKTVHKTLPGGGGEESRRWFFFGGGGMVGVGVQGVVGI